MSIKIWSLLKCDLLTALEILIALTAVVSLLAGCAKATSDQSKLDPDKSEDHVESATESRDWANQEILLQLKEMRADLDSIKSSLAKLNDEIAGSRAVGDSKPERADGHQIARMDLAGIPATGKNNAGVAIVEFSDFECPYCARHHAEVFPRIRKSFIDSGKVKYFSRQYPLPFHSSAHGAAVAALCADKQGKYWAMRDGLFVHRGSLNSALYESNAKEIGLNLKAFADCSADKAVVAQVDADVSYGDSIGVSGTPKFFIGRVSGNTLVNAVVLDGAQPYDAFVAAIDKQLAK